MVGMKCKNICEWIWHPFDLQKPFLVIDFCGIPLNNKGEPPGRFA